MKVLNFGSINIDNSYMVPHIVRPGETLTALDTQISAGGKGANQSVALARAGMEVYHGGKIGRDGLWILDLLKKNGVDTSRVMVDDGPTGNAIIQVTEQGENSIVLFSGGNRQIKSDEVDETLSLFNEGDYLVLQNEINLIPEIIEKARKRGMFICLNPAPYSEEIKTWPLHLVDLFILNETEARDMTGHSGSYSEILDLLCELYPGKHMVLTAGKDGAYYGRDDRREYSPIVETKVVDTTAAGDTFTGYFIASIATGEPVKDALDRASRASSITVSRRGAMESIP